MVLSDRAAVTMYAVGRHVSKDVDPVRVHFVIRRRIQAAVEEIGLRETAKYFHRARSKHIVESLPGPLGTDDQPGLQQAALVAKQRRVEEPRNRQWSAKLSMLLISVILRQKCSTKKPAGWYAPCRRCEWAGASRRI